jgi:hypothetical protein
VLGDADASPRRGDRVLVACALRDTNARPAPAECDFSAATTSGRDGSVGRHRRGLIVSHRSSSSAAPDSALGSVMVRPSKGAAAAGSRSTFSTPIPEPIPDGSAWNIRDEYGVEVRQVKVFPNPEA